SLGEEEAAAAREAILSGWLTQGPEVAAFEREFAEYVGAPHACAVSNCTTALHLALLALGVGPGDEVVTVSHSFIATANAVRYCGATPVFVDIDPQTFNIDPALVEAAITPRTKAIMPVHQMGMPCDMAAIQAIAERHGLPVVEDAACAVGRVQLRRLPEILERRRELADVYNRALRGIQGLEVPQVPGYARPNFQSYPVRVTPEYPMSRDELMQSLLEVGISSRRGVMNA